MVGTGGVGAMLYRGTQSGSPEVLAKYLFRLQSFWAEKHYRKKRRLQLYHDADRGASGESSPPVDTSRECRTCRRRDHAPAASRWTALLRNQCPVCGCLLWVRFYIFKGTRSYTPFR